MEKCKRCSKKEQELSCLWIPRVEDLNIKELPFTKIETCYSIRICKDCYQAWNDGVKKWENHASPKPRYASKSYINQFWKPMNTKVYEF